MSKIKIRVLFYFIFFLFIFYFIFLIGLCVLCAQSCPSLCDPMDCSPADFSVHEISQAGVCCHFLLQEIFRTQGSNLCLLHWQADYLPPSHLGNPFCRPGWSPGPPRSSVFSRSQNDFSLLSSVDQELNILLRTREAC